MTEPKTDSTNPPAGSATAGELVLEPPQAVSPISTSQAAGTIRVDPKTAQQISGAVSSFVDSLAQIETNSPDFTRKVQSVSQMGNQEIRRSAESSNRFLERPTNALNQGPIGETSQVSNALLALRRQVEDLDPSRGLKNPRRRFGLVPFGNRFRDYFHKYQSAQGSIEAIIQALYRGQDELMRDNAAIEQEKANLWAMKGRLEQYSYMASQLDEQLTAKVGQVQASDPERARSLQENVLFYVRQKRQDLLTQLAVTVQGYLALDLVRKNNQELIKGVDRATTTTVSALRTAVMTALALNNQRLVLNQITALNETTGNLIESTSVMLREQTGEIQSQAASATVSVEKLQAAFNNVYATIDMIDTYKVAALDNMKKTIDALSGEVARAQVYIDKAHQADSGQQIAAGAGELILPAHKAG
ncbi:MAG: toxic anion resistance protein [Candidatus Dormibacter sp.]|uniref:toxic anion resistance protein n=1 Tax=Candidatus Dormibacter sp. TaxID=2973982 RepID=UPI000DB8B6AA|nr:MAG: toxic anion resistance protein [Candidatus Dormibacteraeota bacterium]